MFLNGPQKRLAIKSEDAFVAKKAPSLAQALSKSHELEPAKWWSDTLVEKLPDLGQQAPAIANQTLINKLKMLAHKSFIKIIVR